MLTFRFDGAGGRMKVEEILTARMSGKKVRLEFSEDWEGISKTAVFIAGEVVRDVAVLSDEVTIPADVLREPLEQLLVGVYGISADGTVVIPTIRAEGPWIQPGIDPSGDHRSADPALPIWGQLQTAVEDMQLALKEVGSGGYYAPSVTQPDEGTMLITFTPTGTDMPAVDPVTITLPGGSDEVICDGQDGGYYTVSVDQPTEGTARFTFTPSASDMEKIPAQTVTLPAGADGAQGAAGEMGLSIYYSSENVPDSSDQMDYDMGAVASGGRVLRAGDLIVNVHSELFRVTGVSGSMASADYLGTIKGEKGPVGAPGVTPVKGTDYWTSEDIAQIQSYVDEAILGGAW